MTPRAADPTQQVLDLVRSPRAVEDLHAYVDTGAAARHPGGRFEFLGGGGDRPETADRVTADDLVAASLVAAAVPGDVALDLLEGDLGRDVAWHLAHIPTDVGIEEPAAAAHLATWSSAGVAADLLEERPGMTADIAAALLARKRPRLLPVGGSVLRCALDADASWRALHHLFMSSDPGLRDRLVESRQAAGVPEQVSPLRVLDVVLRVCHQPVHLRHGCPGLLRRSLPASAGARNARAPYAGPDKPGEDASWRGT